MKTFVVMAAALLPMVLNAQILAQREKAVSTSETLVERDAVMPLAHGEKGIVKQVLIKNRDGSLTYRFDKQSAETQKWHESFCKQFGEAPAKGDSVLRGEATGGLGCIGQADGAPKAGVISNDGSRKK